MDLGKNLYNLRKNKNLSQEEVAEKLNVTRQTISKWETNESKPDFDKILPICELFNITTEELLIGINTEKKELNETINNKHYYYKCNNIYIIFPIHNISPKLFQFYPIFSKYFPTTFSPPKTLSCSSFNAPHSVISSLPFNSKCTSISPYAYLYLCAYQ